MAELRIQPKKAAPSPWLLVGLAVLLLAAVAYFYLRPDPADEARATSTSAPAPAPADSLAPGSPAAEARATPPPATDSVGTQAAPTSPAGAGNAAATMLLQLSPTLTQLADRADLRDDAAIREQRDNFTSATARLAEGDPHASLRPGLVAAASLLLAVQQKAYPNLESEANSLVQKAGLLSGRNATAAEQAQNRAYLDQLATLLNTMSYPAADVL
ncbi:hypothetical protein GO988_16730 [Hymenobacter sp. HMF4947]|uniref:Uncharacterized protein n=1 Tax=Hymenobacter ginkgonis TaxID=2682976 RepID=A0A7K1THR9_9BACT|nr:hypothetical protein [Hymenobacter ginkgonis]MVN77977.1 hypothetical protein [Hymenobacter ginkgonis]